MLALEPPHSGEVFMHLAESSPPEPSFKSIKIAGVGAACASRWKTIDRGKVPKYRTHIPQDVVFCPRQYSPNSKPYPGMESGIPASKTYAMKHLLSSELVLHSSSILVLEAAPVASSVRKPGDVMVILGSVLIA